MFPRKKPWPSIWVQCQYFFHFNYYHQYFFHFNNYQLYFFHFNYYQQYFFHEVKVVHGGRKVCCVWQWQDKWIYCPRYRTEKESRSSGRCSCNNYALTFSSLLRGLWAEKNRHLILKNLFIEHQSFLHLCPAVVTSTRYTSYSQC